MKRVLGLLLLSLALSACSFETQLEGLDFECSEDLPCGEGFVCDLLEGTCVAEAASAQIPPACINLACPTEDELRCSPEGEVVGVQRCIRDQSLGCLIWDPVHTCADTLECTEDVCDPAKIVCVDGACPPP